MLFGVVAIACLAIGLPARSQTVDDDWLIERLAESAPMDGNHTIEVVNLYGDLRVRAASDDIVAVTAIVQRHRGDHDRPRIEVTREDGKLMVVVRYRNGKPPADPVQRNRRVDVTVFVPEGPSAVLRTEAGLLNVRLGSDLELITLSGMIDVKTAGRLQAQTDRGKVVAVLQAPNWLGENTVRSKTGQIEIWLSRDASAAVDAETSGWLTTDYSVEIQHDEAAGRKIIRARVGQGQSQLRVRSINGAIRLLRSP